MIFYCLLNFDPKLDHKYKSLRRETHRANGPFGLSRSHVTWFIFVTYVSVTGLKRSTKTGFKHTNPRVKLANTDQQELTSAFGQSQELCHDFSVPTATYIYITCEVIISDNY